MPDPQANLNAIDERTHTLYAADPYGNTISVINTATCNATDTTGCGESHAKDHNRLLSGAAAATTRPRTRSIPPTAAHLTSSRINSA